MSFPSYSEIPVLVITEYSNIHMCLLFLVVFSRSNNNIQEMRSIFLKNFTIFVCYHIQNVITHLILVHFRSFIFLNLLHILILRLVISYMKIMCCWLFCSVVQLVILKLHFTIFRNKQHHSFCFKSMVSKLSSSDAKKIKKSENTIKKFFLFQDPILKKWRLNASWFIAKFSIPLFRILIYCFEIFITGSYRKKKTSCTWLHQNVQKLELTI